jgi:hypothetical protein
MYGDETMPDILTLIITDDDILKIHYHQILLENIPELSYSEWELYNEK